MTQIKIYGMLHNDTGEPLASAEQIVDPISGRTVSELLNSILSEEEIMEIANNIKRKD